MLHSEPVGRDGGAPGRSGRCLRGRFARCWSSPLSLLARVSSAVDERLLFSVGGEQFLAG